MRELRNKCPLGNFSLKDCHVHAWKLQVGDRVVALPECKAWAELVSVPAKYVFLLPADISYQEATALTMNYILAYVLLFDLAGITPGKTVLLHSAGGGVVSEH